MRRRYTVYRIEYGTGRKEPIGCIEERRKSERAALKNYFALLVKARTLFGNGPNDRIRIVLDPPDGENPWEETGHAKSENEEEPELQR